MDQQAAIIMAINLWLNVRETCREAGIHDEDAQREIYRAAFSMGAYRPVLPPKRP